MGKGHPDPLTGEWEKSQLHLLKKQHKINAENMTLQCHLAAFENICNMDYSPYI